MSIPRHHKRQAVCSSRAPYREGRKPKAVKVYTVNQESQYLLVQGVPAVGATHELIKLFAVYGAIAEYRILDDYPAEHFTEVYLIKFEKIQAARTAKRKLDDWSFYGGVLHVCYAPEYESVQETREKLQDRRKAIAAKVRQYERDGTYSLPYPSPSHNAPDSQNQTSIPLRENQIQDKELFKGETEREATQHISYPTMPDAQISELNRPNMSGTLFQNMQSYQYSPESGGSQNFGQKETVLKGKMGNNILHSQNRNKTEYFDSKSISGSKESSYLGNTSAHANNLGNTSAHANSWNRPTQTSVRSHTATSESPEEQEVQLKLPLPPKQMHHGMSRHNQRLQHYTYAHVPTAQAEFPVDYDARLGLSKESGLPSAYLKLHQVHDKSSDKLANSDLLDQKEQETLSSGKTIDASETECSKSMQEKIEENLKRKTDVVIKKIDKTRPIPKFIPRQAQIKNKPATAQTEVDKVKGGEDEILNRELKKNAFTLGKPQGPIHPGSELVKETEKSEESVEKTVKDIRKRMMQMSDNKNLLTKKTKTA